VREVDFALIAYQSGSKNYFRAGRMALKVGRLKA